MYPPSLRTTESEKAYQEAIASGRTHDISRLGGTEIKGLTLLSNGYPYDMAHEVNDMILGGRTFTEFWLKLGALIESRELNYDQLIFNFPAKQSQPHIQHAHLMKFKQRKDFKL